MVHGSRTCQKLCATTLRDNEIEPVVAEATAALIREPAAASPRRPMPRGCRSRRYFLKNVGSRTDLLEKIRKFATEDGVPTTPSGTTGANSGRRHLLPMRVGQADLDGGYLLSGLASFADDAVTPCVVLEYSGRDATLALVKSLARQLRSVGTDDVTVWLDVAHDEHG